MKKTNYYNNYYKKSHKNKNNSKEYKKPETTLCKPIIKNTFNYYKKMLISKPIPELSFTEEAWLKIKTYIELIGDYEIGGLGRVVDGKIIDIKILKQTVEAAYYESSEQAVLDFIREIPREQINEWCLDWHSHVNMGVSPSLTDYTNYEKLYSMSMDKPFPALVINKKDDINGFTCFGNNVYKKTNIIIPDITRITEQQYLDIYSECYNEIMNKCMVKKHFYYSNYNNMANNSKCANILEHTDNNNCLENTNNECEELCGSTYFCNTCNTSLTEDEFINNGLLCDDCSSPHGAGF